MSDTFVMVTDSTYDEAVKDNFMNKRVLIFNDSFALYPVHIGAAEMKVPLQDNVIQIEEKFILIVYPFGNMKLETFREKAEEAGLSTEEITYDTQGNENYTLKLKDMTLGKVMKITSTGSSLFQPTKEFTNKLSEFDSIPQEFNKLYELLKELG